MKYDAIRLLAVVALVLWSTTAFGQLVLQETFNTPTTNLGTVSGWTVVTNVGATTTGGPPYIVVNSGSALEYPGYMESGVGNSAYLSGGGQDAQEPVSTITVPTSGTLAVYLAFMIKVDTASGAGDYVWLVRNTSNHNRWRMWLKSTNSGANFEFGIGKGTANKQWTNGSYSFHQTYLVVAKYDFNTTGGTDALMSLWVNPDPNSFGRYEDTVFAIKNYSDASSNDFSTNINRFALIMNDTTNAPTFSIGGIRMGLSWAAILPPPPVYYNGTGPIDDVNSWGSNLDGSGDHPADFFGDSQLWMVRNTTAVTLDVTWVVGGWSSKVVIGPGVNFTVGSNGILSAIVDVNNGATLTLTRAFYWPTFGDIAGTVALDNPAGITLDADYIFPVGSGYFNLVSGDLDLGGFTLTVKGRLQCNDHKVLGNGTFILDSAATIRLGSPEGISLSGATGNIQAATRQFSRYASYTYDGATSQVTGDAIPDTVANLSIQMVHRDSVVVLSKPTATKGNLTLTLGKFVLGDYDLWFSNPSGQSDSGYVITNGTGSLIRPIANMNKKTMPIGSATEYRVAVLTFEGNPDTTNIAFRYVTSDPGSFGLPDSVTRYYTGGYWTINSDGVPGQTFRLDLRTAGIPFDTLGMRILGRPAADSAWSLVGTSGITTYSAGVVAVPGVANFGQFAIGDHLLPAGVRNGSGLPRTIALLNNYPNPFNPTTSIEYQLPAQMKVSIEVFNILGQSVTKLVDDVKPAGNHMVKFDAARLSSGLYFYQLRAGNTVLTKKMLLVK